MRVALIGPPLSGKSTLFAAVAEAEGSNVDLSRPDAPHLAVVKVPDTRVDWLSGLYSPKKITYAELEFLDLPGLDLSDAAARERFKSHWPALRQSDMLVMVVRGFEEATVPAYRDRVDPAADVEELLAELLFADLEQVAARIEKLQLALKKPTAQREQNQRELDLMTRLQQALESETPISEAIANETEEKWVRSFGFLSLKPLLAVVNVGEDRVAEPAPEALSGVTAMQLSAKIEEEIAQLSAEDRAEFLSDLGLDSPAKDRLIRACYQRCRLVSFLTAGEPEVRAWSIPAGTSAAEAAGAIHTDLQRGFIRAETVAFADLRAAGDMKSAKAAGKVRLEGKNYVVQDGDVIYFRFNV